MVHILALLLALMQLLSLSPLHTGAPDAVTQRLRSGEWLRLHVIAQDDTPDMQHLKLLVRDAVRDCYAANRPQDATMIAATQSLLPQLTRAAREAAQAAGFTGEVEVELGSHRFDDRQLAGLTVPAGEYPALVIRLGDGQGRNWWGLIDPDAALMLAAVSQEDTEGADHRQEEESTEKKAPVFWDWSWQALLSAIFGLPMQAK